MRFEMQPGGKRIGRGSNGRVYTIGYQRGGISRPWVLEEDEFSQHATLEDAESRAHEVEAIKLGGD